MVMRQRSTHKTHSVQSKIFLIGVCVQDLFNATEVDAASLTISVNKQLFASVNHID